MTQPKTLHEAIKFFANPDNALAYMVKLRWPGGVVCPTCGRKDARFLANQGKWQCKSVHAKRQFSAKVGTIFEDSPISLDKWLAAVCRANWQDGYDGFQLPCVLSAVRSGSLLSLPPMRDFQ